MEELKYSKVEEIKVDSPLVEAVNFKPKAAPIICIIAGAAICFVPGVLPKILGCVFIIFAFLVIRYVQDKKVMDIYKDGAVIYNSKDQSLAFWLDFAQVSEWRVDRGNGQDAIIFIFSDGSKLPVVSFNISKAYYSLDKVLHDKEERVIQAEKNKQMKWANPVDTLRNLGKIFTSKK